MTAIELMIENGDHRRGVHIPEIRGNVLLVSPTYESCKRFMARVVSRAILDLSMYGEDSPNHKSARDWIDGGLSASGLSFEEAVELIDMEWILDHMHDLLKGEGAPTEKIRNMKRLLYHVSENDGEGSTT